jgi:hypothetical protein
MKVDDAVNPHQSRRKTACTDASHFFSGTGQSKYGEEIQKYYHQLSWRGRAYPAPLGGWRGFDPRQLQRTKRAFFPPLAI